MNKSIKVNDKILPRYDEIITGEALKFLEEIHNKFNIKRLQALDERKKRQKAIDNGDKLDFLNETKKMASIKIINAINQGDQIDTINIIGELPDDDVINKQIQIWNQILDN